MCFLKCIKYFTNKNYTEDIQDFNRSEKYRSGLMTCSKIQPHFVEHNTKIGCFDGSRINPKTIFERNISLFIHNDSFCLLWKSNGTSFNQVIEEFKLNLKVVDIVRSDKHVKIVLKNNVIPEKVQSPITNIVVDDLETYNKD